MSCAASDPVRTPLLFLGTGEFGRPALRRLHDAGWPIERVVSQPDRPAGRGRAIRPTPLHALSDELSLPHLQAADINAFDPHELAGAARLGVVIDFGQKIGAGLLKALPHGFVNLHGSLLPRYRGAAPVQWAILNGDAVTGATVFQLNEAWDAGAILGQVETPIAETETADELHDRLAVLGAELLVALLPKIVSGAARPVPQPSDAASRAPKLSRTLSPIDWSRPAGEIVRRIHALWSWPAAACIFQARSGRTERLLLKRGRCVDPHTPPTTEAPPGAFRPDRSVQTGCGRLELLEVQPAGGRVMSFDAFANGRNIAPPDRLIQEAP